MELMVRDMGQLTHIECSVKRAKWTQVLAVLKLSPTQQDQLMANRKEHLNKLRKVYQERQELNMQVGARSLLSTSRWVHARSSKYAGVCMIGPLNMQVGACLVLSRLHEAGCQLQTGVSSDKSRDSMIRFDVVL